MQKKFKTVSADCSCEKLFMRANYLIYLIIVLSLFYVMLVNFILIGDFGDLFVLVGENLYIICKTWTARPISYNQGNPNNLRSQQWRKIKQYPLHTTNTRQLNNNVISWPKLFFHSKIMQKNSQIRVVWSFNYESNKKTNIVFSAIKNEKHS